MASDYETWMVRIDGFVSNFPLEVTICIVNPA